VAAGVGAHGRRSSSLVGLNIARRWRRSDSYSTHVAGLRLSSLQIFGETGSRRYPFRNLRALLKANRANPSKATMVGSGSRGTTLVSVTVQLAALHGTAKAPPPERPGAMHSPWTLATVSVLSAVVAETF